MNERARRLGGRLAIDTNGAGTRVVVAVPLDSDVPEPGPTPRTFPRGDHVMTGTRRTDQDPHRR